MATHSHFLDFSNSLVSSHRSTYGILSQYSHWRILPFVSASQMVEVSSKTGAEFECHVYAWIPSHLEWLATGSVNQTCQSPTVSHWVINLRCLNRLVRFGPFLNEGLWTGADDMRVYKCGSEARRRVAWVRAWPKNVGVARVEATRSMGKRVSYWMYWFSAWWSLSRKGF